MDASDAENDAFLILHQMRERWEDAKAAHLTPEHQERVIVAWARLRLIDQYTREFHRQQKTMNLSTTKLEPNAPPLEMRLIDRKGEAESKRLSNMERAEVEQLVDRLPAVQREVVKLLLYEGVTQHEAARRLAVTQPAVAQAYQRAQDALRELLSEYGDYL